MKIILPKRETIEDKLSIVLIGANGSGKTRMSIWVEENNPEINTHRISAQKSLNFPEIISPVEMEKAREEFIYGDTSSDKQWLKHYGKKSNRWGNAPETHLLNDFEKLMKYLITEDYEKSIEFRKEYKNGNKNFDNFTRLEKVIEIWEKIITHRKLNISAGKIETTNLAKEYKYNGNQMSDGERAIFYFIGEVLCAEENSLIIIDEPENHLHKSILIKLWDAIEAVRQDCIFMYITHNLDFASSRINSQIIWVEEFSSNNKWKYESIEDIDALDSLKLEIMGNRQEVLLVEGSQSKSIDKKLYSKIYSEYNVLSLESCNSVVQTTKAYNKTSDLHYVKVRGLIDRDRRDEAEIEQLKENNIFVPEVSEIENLFLLDDVIEIVAKKLYKNDNEITQIIQDVHEKTFKFLKENIEKQALLFTKQKYQNKIIQKINEKVSNIEEYKSNIQELTSLDNLETIYEQEIKKIDKIIQEKNYLEALKIINDKGLLPYTNLSNNFGWKKDTYIDFVLLLLEQKEIGDKLKHIFRAHIELE